MLLDWLEFFSVLLFQVRLQIRFCPSSRLPRAIREGAEGAWPQLSRFHVGQSSLRRDCWLLSQPGSRKLLGSEQQPL